MIIKKVDNEKEAIKCDKLLEKLIKEEAKINNNLKKDYIVKDYFKKLYLNDNNVVFIAVDENIIGYIYVKIISSENVTINNEALVDGLYVEEEYRNKGIGTLLIKEAKKWAKEKSAKYITLNVLSKNEEAKNLYYKEDFKEFSINLKYEL